MSSSADQDTVRSDPPRRDAAPPARRRGYGWVVALIVVLGLLIAGGMALRSIISAANPFGDTVTVDRTGPAVLQAIEDLSEYRAATGHYQVIVDVEEQAPVLPAILRGERTLFVANGTVDASVDFSSLGDGAVEVSQDRQRVAVRLPGAALSEAQVDPEESYVFDRQRGFIDRLAGVFSDEPTSERELYLLAEDRLEAAAEQGSLTATAEQNTRAMLDSLLRSLGFTDVTVTFES